MKKFIYLITSVFAFVFSSSCNSNSRENPIVGTWIPIRTDDRNAAGMSIRFLENNIGIAEFKGEQPQPGDTVTYEIKNEGKLLVTTEKSGRVEEMEIIELTNKNLILFSKMQRDTMKLTRK